MLKWADLGRVRLGSPEGNPAERAPIWVWLGRACAIGLIFLSSFELGWGWVRRSVNGLSAELA